MTSEEPVTKPNDRDGWHDISTAPKDIPIRVFGPDPTHGEYKGPAKWDGHHWRKLHRNGFINMTAYPTHWQPLPSPDAKKTEPSA